MVDHSTKQVNRFKRGVLISAIVVIGLLDLAFTTYLTRDELAGQDVKGRQVFAVPDIATILPLGNVESKDDIMTNDEATYSSDGQRRLRPVRYFVRASANNFRRPQNAPPDHQRSTGFDESTLSCRTVTYPFVNDTYYVRVTDDTGCLTARRPKFNHDQLVASLIPPRNSR